MIVIDTNVLSEMMRADPAEKVVAWVHGAGRVHISAVTLAEIEHGIARQPEGSRKDRLAATATAVFTDFEDVILPFDARAARRYGRIVAGRERNGRPITIADAQIAAICASRHATLATRNIADFEETGIRLIDPWKS